MNQYVEKSDQTGIDCCRVQGVFHTYPPTDIPWWLAEVAYRAYARRYGARQTLDRIVERGGFGREELLMLIHDAVQKDLVNT